MSHKKYFLEIFLLVEFIRAVLTHAWVYIAFTFLLDLVRAKKNELHRIGGSVTTTTVDIQ
jgi:hypothetical protein